MTDKLNLYQKISEIIGSLGAIPKDSKAPKEMGGYGFSSHGAVLAHLRHELTTRNVVIHSSGEELLHHEAFEKRTITDYNGKTAEKISYNFHSIIKYKFTVVDGDNPSDFFEDFWIGEGMDTQDKGVQKAGTSADKYYLMKLFKIGDKDDPDAIDSTGSGAISDSATINRTGQTAVSRPPEPTEAKVEQVVSENGSPSVSAQSPEDAKKQLDAVIWLGEQLPQTSGWFRGKIVALAQLYDNQKKLGKLTPEQLEAGSGNIYIYSQLVKAHEENCGKNCEHVTVAALALKTHGTIQDPAKA